MTPHRDFMLTNSVIKLLLLSVIFCFSTQVLPADIQLPGISIDLGNDTGGEEPERVANALKVVLILTVLSLAPALLMVMTSFTRIIIILSMLRHALGMQQTPPNTVIISLAIFLTLFNMMPVFNEIGSHAFDPYIKGELETEVAMEKAMAPLRAFMIRQTREVDLALMVDVSGSDMPESLETTRTVHLIPAFMLSELKTAFQIGFVIFLPFLLIDIVVSSILMSMGMLMVPPMMISLPIKILMFVLIDGWNLVVHSILSSFQ